MQGRGRSAVVAASIAALAIGWVAGPAGAAITVTSQDDTTLAKFKSPKCKLKRGNGPNKGFTATDKDDGWKLSVRVYGQFFDGFHSYEVEYGTEGPADFFVFRRQGPSFSNVVKPEPPGPTELTLGGGIHFPNKRKVVGIGFPIAYDNPTAPAWVTVVGQARCEYR